MTMPPTPTQPDDPSLSRFQRYLPKGRDVTLIILRGHLLVEEELNELLELLVHNPQHLQKARLSFAQRVRLVHALYPARGASEPLMVAIEKLNSLRNSLAHQLEPKDLTASICQFNAAALASVSKSGRADVEKSYTIKELKMSIAFLVGRLGWLKSGAHQTPRGNERAT
jgi:hypothetical protein